MSLTKKLSPAQLDGTACVVCGDSHRAMLPIGVETKSSTETFRCDRSECSISPALVQSWVISSGAAPKQTKSARLFQVHYAWIDETGTVRRAHTVETAPSQIDANANFQRRTLHVCVIDAGTNIAARGFRECLVRSLASLEGTARELGA